MVPFHVFAFFGSQLLLWICAALLFYKGDYKRVPVFASYVAAHSVLSLISDIVSIAVGRGFVTIISFRWITVAETGITAVLEIAVLYELAHDLVLSRASLSSAARQLMRWTAAILLLAAAGTAAFLGRPGLERVMAAFQALDFSSSIIAFGLLTVLLIFTRALQISWHSLPTGIALGLAVTGSTEIAGSALLSVTTRAQYMEIDSARLTGFVVCVLIWLVYILLPDNQAHYSGEPLKLDELKNWDDQMQKIQR
jgi:hypothetical protein